MANQQLSHARFLRRWTAEEAGKRVGVSTITYKRWEKGSHVPNMSSLDLLCIAFGEEPEHLGYIIEENGHIRLKTAEEYVLPTEDDPEMPTDDLAQAHAEMLESIRRSLRMLAGTASSEPEASELDKLMSDVVSTLAPSLDIEAVGVGLWLCDRVDRLKKISTCERITCQQYLVILYFEIESWKRVIDEDYQRTDAYHYTRRTVIESLLLLPAPLLTGVQWSSRPDFAAQDFLTQCAPCIMACSYLLNADGLATVEHTLPQYLRQLSRMAKSPSPFQRQSAYLAAQACCLMGLVRLHRRQIGYAVADCNKAVDFAKVTGNRLLVAATYTRLGTAWSSSFDLGTAWSPLSDQAQKYLEAYQEAERLLKEAPVLFPARLQSRIYMGLSNAHALLGNKQDAEYYLGMANAIPLPLNDDLFIPCLDYDLSGKIVVEGQVYVNLAKLNDPGPNTALSKEARTLYEKADTVLGQRLPTDVRERSRLQGVNQRAEIAVKLGNMEQFEQYIRAVVQGAKDIGSDARLRGAKDVWSAAIEQWPNEAQVMRLDDLFDQDGDA